MDILAYVRMLSRILVLFCFGWTSAWAAEPPSPAPQIPLTQTLVRQDGMLLTVEGWLLTKADRATAWAVLTDYSHFPDFVPGIYVNKILERGNGTLSIEQKGEVVAGQFRMPYEGVMTVREHKKEGMTVQFLSGLLKDIEGEWHIQAQAGQPGHLLKLTYQMRVDLMKSSFPAPIAPAVTEQQVRTWVEVLGREMDRRAAQ